MKNLGLDKIYELYRLLTRNHLTKLDFHKTYPQLVRSLKKRNTIDQAMKLAVGGEDVEIDSDLLMPGNRLEYEENAK